LSEDGKKMAKGSLDPLESLGFTERFQALFVPYAGEGLEPGRVIRSDRGQALVATRSGSIRAEVSARLRKEAASPTDMPVAGDWVAVLTDSDHEIALIEAVLPRSSAFTRGDPGEAAVAQVLAANIDTVFVMHPISEEPNLRRIERELALAWESGAVPVVVLSKSDLSDAAKEAREAVESVALGVDVITTSAVSGEGVQELLAYADGHRTIALIGSSGVGKSTLVNRLVGEEVQDTADVRSSDGKGRHTTVAREIIPLPNGGVLLDTPGLRAIALWDAEEGIAATFPDIEDLTPQCKFRDCSHVSEPGCAVLAAVEDGRISAERFESYHKLKHEVRVVAAMRDVRLRAEEQRKWKIIRKASRRYFKNEGHK